MNPTQLMIGDFDVVFECLIQSLCLGTYETK